MSAPMHTPGPWRTSLVDDTVVIHIGTDGVHHEVASIDGDYNEPDLWPIMEANARLIAAAPELLAAGKAALQLWDDLYSNMVGGDGDEGEREAFDALRDAIAKATEAGALAKVAKP